MSDPLKHYQIQALVRASALHYTVRAVLLEVSYRAFGERSLCFESQETIAANTGIGVRTVRRDLDDLEKMGVLVVVPDKGRRSTTYRVRGAAIPARPAGDPAPPAEYLAPDADPEPAPPAGYAAPYAGDTGIPCQVPGIPCQSDRHPMPPIRSLIRSSDPGGGGTRAREAPPPTAPLASGNGHGGPATGERSEQDGPPQWAFGWGGIPTAEVVELVCRILGLIRARPVRPKEAARDAARVRLVFELDPDRPLSELADQVQFVADWAAKSPQGRDELGGIRQRTGEVWGLDKSRRPAAVLDPERWLDWLDSAVRWHAGAEPPAQRRGWHPGVPDPQTPEELEEAHRMLATFDLVQ